MKVIIVKGCKDCPYLTETDPLANLGGCKLYEFMFDAEIPETPHPDCKLNDLPTESDITDECFKNLHSHSSKSIIHGANFIINKITK